MPCMFIILQLVPLGKGWAIAIVVYAKAALASAVAMGTHAVNNRTSLVSVLPS